MDFLKENVEDMCIRINLIIVPQVSSLAYGSLINAFQSDKLKLYNYFNDDQHILYILLYIFILMYIKRCPIPHSLGGNNTVQGPNIIAATRGFYISGAPVQQTFIFFKIKFQFIEFNIH